MSRWFYGSAVVIYLAGLFGLGLSEQLLRAELGVADAMAYGAGWPVLVLRALDVI